MTFNTQTSPGASGFLKFNPPPSYGAPTGRVRAHLVQRERLRNGAAPRDVDSRSRSPALPMPVRPAVLAALFVATGCASSERDAPEVPPVPESATPDAVPSAETASDSVTVVFFGDSLTAGYGLATPQREAYPALVGARLAEADLPARVVNLGVSGETSAGGRSRAAWALARNRPDVFVLALGANDGLRGVDPDATRENLAAILTAAREAAPEARLVVLGMEALPNYGTDYTARFRAVFPAVAEAAGARLVPFFLDGVAGVRALNQPDGVHPTAEGQRRIAATVAPVVVEAVREAASAGA